MEIPEFFTVTGNTVTTYASKGIDYLSNQTPAKIIAIILLLGIAFLGLKIAHKIIKWTIIILAIFLAISTGITLFT